MYKIFTVLVVLVMAIAITAPAFSATASNETAVQLQRGAKNLALGWTDIPKNIVDTSKNENALLGVTVGTAKGVFNAVARTISGAFDIITFPAGQEKPAIKPRMTSYAATDKAAPSTKTSMKPAKRPAIKSESTCK